MLMIILVGLARSGKDTVADYLQQKYGFKKVVFSDFIADEVSGRGLPVTKDNLSKVGDEMRGQRGMGIVAELLWEKAKGCEKVVAVGARSAEEIDFLKGKVETVFVVKIHASREKRFARKGRDEPLTEDAFFARDKRDIKNKGMQGVIDSADFTVENNSSLGDLRKAVDKFIAGASSVPNK